MLSISYGDLQMLLCFFIWVKYSLSSTYKHLMTLLMILVVADKFLFNEWSADNEKCTT